MYYLDTSKTQKCDILLTTTTHFPSKVIRLGTGSDISHASLLVDPHVLIDSTGEGIQSRNIERLEYEDECSIHLMRLKETITDDEKMQIENFARERIGQRYNTSQAFMAGLRQRGIIKNGPEEKGMFCSRLVAEAFESVGIKLVKDSQYCTPADLLHSPMLEEIHDISRIVPNEGFISVKKHGRDFDQEMRDKTNKLLESVRKIDPKIETLNDIDWFLINNPEQDNAILTAFEESGYLTHEDEIFEATQYLYDPTLYMAYFQGNSKHHCLTVSLVEDTSRFDVCLGGYIEYVKQYGLKTFEALRKLYEKLVDHAQRRKLCALTVLNTLTSSNFKLFDVEDVDEDENEISLSDCFNGVVVTVDIDRQQYQDLVNDGIREGSCVCAEVTQTSSCGYGLVKIIKIK
ncbi:YiiX/YebB-like N1pC/P60 family cysteine hydrolase [Fibrobacter sp. UWR2]|uniref:YiiX/YebB-like N1pC/P60 family cysteine hydrolase n=1 Tax=Fibrobacter sp. UWR2 TaxID=1964352 RepID=UPI000B524E4B|nr:YiiX/YebB-like N1pC/P60 family cysteine hydrolase [Fibrobacter sp. UWR2]OWU99274.1 hypothetical protein B7994_11235 [Fibrobacter sp. UWR2]